MPGPSSETPSWTTPSWIPQSIRIAVSGGAYLTAFSTRCSTICRRRGGSARPWSRTLGRISTRWRSRIGRSEATTSSTSTPRSTGVTTAQWRLVGQQVGVGPDDRQRRPQLMGDQGDELAARLVDRLERLDACLGLGLLAALLDDPGEEIRDRAELRDI